MSLFKEELYEQAPFVFVGIVTCVVLYIVIFHSGSSEISLRAYDDVSSFYNIEACQSLIDSSFDDRVITNDEYYFIKGCADEQPKRHFSTLVTEAQ
ncbi:hypothetical protein VII00023_20757 [Vibrio ichthyoenteri ATCC 700023]|uniref:Uncharacterized protein n=1 Tax=Vibrio ichthyoenteri ATCC 700023 TaxID=870968 RepID=F9S7W4_9VIBR|nr:hypothetical protein [Vibrio ichthyoenteri]EGU31014.1 hypothetical protein VII00023_20757 [Vibrio ichthyoenteri ATCC 700023]